MRSLPEGTVSVLFTDVVGSSSLPGRLGDAAAHELLRGQRDLVRQQLLTHGGYEVKSMGDGFMLAFSSARKAVACAVGIQRTLGQQNLSQPDDLQLLLRMGVNTGEAIQEDGDLFGETVNAAARIMAIAEGGQILVSDTVKAVLGRSREFELLDRGAVTLKNIPDPWHVFEVNWHQEPPAALVAFDRTPMVGRKAERDRLRELLHKVASGGGAIELIGGEPGVGKTRLTLEAVEEAQRRGFISLTGGCHEGQGLPYGPFVEMLESAARQLAPQALLATMGDSAPEIARLMPELRRLFPDIEASPEMPPEEERRYLFNAVSRFIGRAAAGQPLLLIAEDLHWADSSTLQLLAHVAQHLPEMHVLVLGTYREAEVGAELAGALQEVVRSHSGGLMPLKRLAESDVASMLQVLAGKEAPSRLTKLFYQQTEGNPFFIEEIFKHWREEGKLFSDDGRWRLDVDAGQVDIPESARLVIGWRLLRVSEECRQTLTLAAVIGRYFNFDLLERAGDFTSDQVLDALDEAVASGLVAEAPAQAAGSFAFGHELIRQTLLSLVTGARRQRMHLRTADGIESLLGVTGDTAADLAYHLGAAGNPTPMRSVDCLVLAGQRALDSAAFDDASRFFERALTVLPASERSFRANLLFLHGQALRSLRWDDALAVWREALDTFEELGDRASVGRIAADVTIQLLWAARFLEGMEIARRGLATLGEADPVDSCRLQAAGALALSQAGAFEMARTMSDAAVELAETLGDKRVLGEVVGYKSVHHWCFSQPLKTVEVGRRSAEICLAVGETWYFTTVMGFVAQGLFFGGKFAELDDLIAEIEPLGLRLGHVGTVLNSRRARAEMTLARGGDLQEYAVSSEDDIEYCKQANAPWISVAYSRVAATLFWGGKWQEALTPSRLAVAAAPGGFWGGIDLSRELLIKAYLGHRDECLAAFARPDALPTKTGQPLTSGAASMLVFGVESLALLGETGRAASLYPWVADRIEEGVVMYPVWSSLMETMAGISASCGEQWELAEQHFEKGLRQSREIPHRLAEPETLRWYARMLLARQGDGDTERADSYLRQAISLYDVLGMTGHSRLTKEMLNAGT